MAFGFGRKNKNKDDRYADAEDAALGLNDGGISGDADAAQLGLPPDPSDTVYDRALHGPLDESEVEGRDGYVDLGALLVTRGTEILGIISERDYARKVVLKGKFSRDVPVSEIMTSRVLYVGPSQTTDECMALMIDKRVRHLPVVENECLVGFISVGDVVKAVIDEKQLLITELENYITGRR